MGNTLLYSNIILWIVVIVQTLFIFLLTKSITHFLNNLRIEKTNSNLLTVGKKAPLFKEVDEKGSLIKLSDFNDSFTLLFFADDVCNICKETFALIKNKIPDSMRLVIIADENPGIESLSTLVSENNMSLIRSNDIPINYQINEVPTLFLLDKYHVIKEIYSHNEVQELIKDLALQNHKAS